MPYLKNIVYMIKKTFVYPKHLCFKFLKHAEKHHELWVRLSTSNYVLDFGPAAMFCKIPKQYFVLDLVNVTKQTSTKKDP